MLQEMPTSKGGVGVQLFNIAAWGIAEPISRLINRISTRNFPSKWKIAKR